MDNNKHKDWTGAVRERLEGRELTPSDALWEQIGAAVPLAGAPRKVRRLAWGGAVGAAAAAALAAVLFLRPAGTKEDGRIEVVPTATTPLAEQVAVTEPDAVTEVGDVAAQSLSASPMRAVTATPGIVPANALRTAAEEQLDTAEESVASVQKTGTDVMTAMEKDDRPALAEDTAMSLEDFLAGEEKGRKPARRLTAAIYAGGMVSTGSLVMNDKPDLWNDSFASVPKPGASYISGEGLANSGTGVSYDPENPKGYVIDRDFTDIPKNNAAAGLNHSRPVSAGVALSFPLNDHLFLESGLYYSYLHSTASRISDQSLHFVGIPVKAGWRLGMSHRTSLSLSAGAKAEKCVLALRDGQRFKEPGIQLAAVGSAAFQYDFTPRVGIFLAPELSYWFTKTELPTYNTENPFNLSLKAGINLTVGN